MTCGVVENASRFPTAPTGPTNADLIEDFPKSKVRKIIDTTNFVEWLIREGTLNKSNLPIYSYSNREEKYFINITPKHKIPERDGQWQRVGEFFIDTKYNADGHKKNILHALTVLQISNIDIKISFR